MPAARFSLTVGLLPPGKTDWQLSSILLASGREQPPTTLLSSVRLDTSIFQDWYFSTSPASCLVTDQNGRATILDAISFSSLTWRDQWSLFDNKEFVGIQTELAESMKAAWRYVVIDRVTRVMRSSLSLFVWQCLPSFWLHELLHGTYNHFRCVLWTASIEFDALIEKNWKFKWTSSSSRCSTVSGLWSSLVYGQDHADMLSASGHGLARPGLTVWWPRWSLRHYSWLLRPHTWSIPRRNGPP